MLAIPHEQQSTAVLDTLSEVRRLLDQLVLTLAHPAPPPTAPLPAAPPAQTEPAYTMEEVGRLLRLSRTSVYEGVRTGDIPAFRIGRRILAPKSAIDRMLT